MATTPQAAPLNGQDINDFPCPQPCDVVVWNACCNSVHITMSSDSRVDDFDFINAREAYQRLSCNEVELPGEVLVLVKSIRAYLARGEVEPRVISGPLTTNQETQDRLNEFESRAAFRLALDEAREIFNRLDPGEQDCAADIKRIRSILTKVGCPIRLLQCASTGATDEQVEARLRAIEAACSRPSQRSR